eukprot:CAMPEP_0182449764 /NCGR_PEP_ID=MMETSP1172-20130603/36529_1 /TAXON_ID=708627 /ORGANISM="Timspurckia oligopyrenoides, Strain CCMP3278" /LENGTH=40 /DNA_ID= /DNA_START= /DNA_END= /DNA_ORIENTATION=
MSSKPSILSLYAETNADLVPHPRPHTAARYATDDADHLVI